MAPIEIRNYRGDYQDVAEFSKRVWLSEYGGRIWFPILDAAFLRWRLSSESAALSPTAYDGDAIVGSVSSFSHSLRVRGVVYPVALHTSFTVAPSSGRVALPLIQRLRQDNEESGVAFGIGMVLDDPTSASYRFWTKYAETYPQNFQLVFRGGYWAKFLKPRVLASASIKAWERLGNRAFGPLLCFSPFKLNQNVRQYRASDLNRCSEILERYTASFDWAMAWRKDQLASQLQNPAYETLVFEREGVVQGIVNFHQNWMYGRELVRTAIIDIWADDGMSSLNRVRFLSHLCTHLTECNVAAVVAPRSTMMPGPAFVANLFVPAPQNYYIGVFSTKRAPAPLPPKTWDLLIM